MYLRRNHTILSWQANLRAQLCDTLLSIPVTCKDFLSRTAENIQNPVFYQEYMEI